ncbi:unnamed protein product, partial [Rotaria sp. Silwood1]
MADNSDVKNSISLVLGPEWLREMKSPTIKVFSTLKELLDNISQPENSNDSFRVFIPGQYIEHLIKNDIHNSVHVDSIHSYYNSEVDFQLHTKQYQSISNKLHFLMTADLAARLLAAFGLHSTHQVGTGNQSISKPSRARRKTKTKGRRVVVSNTVSFDMKCHKCSSVFQDPFQLACGHRQCRSCIDKQEGTMIRCVDCQTETRREE